MCLLSLKQKEFFLTAVNAIVFCNKYNIHTTKEWLVKIYCIFLALCSSLYCIDGKVVFEKYCWGCHHQTSLAFGPSFSAIANSRTKAQIIAHINNPKDSYKSLGYKRSVMPPFNLSSDEYEAISEYIISFKGL